jgi:hypothetical protein
MTRKAACLPALAALLSSCGSGNAPQSFAGLVRVSDAALPAGCSAAGQSGTFYSGSEVEPYLAVDPTDPAHLIGVWQQDRWSNGGAAGLMTGVSFDGGHTWIRTSGRFTQCTGNPAYERGSDPWVSIGPRGTAHQIGFGFNNHSATKAMMASRSLDGGRTWTAPIELQRDTNPDFAIDKESITADPLDSQLVYAVWDRLTGFTNPTSPDNTGPTWFTRSTDDGVTWEPARPIYDPGPDTQTVSNQIVVLPDGTLINFFTLITQNSSKNPRSTAAVLRSTDKGLTWPQLVLIAEEQFVGAVNPKTGKGVRSGNVVPSIAVDAASGALYAAWEDARFSAGERDGIAFSRSTDGGLSWSAPAQANRAPRAQAFTPALAVAQGGKLGLAYYDLRNDVASDSDHLLATRWLATSSDGGATWQETLLGGPFDLQNAPFAEGYFLGDYQGLASAGGSFLPLFVAVNNGSTSNRTDVFFRPPDAALSATPAVAQVEGEQVGFLRSMRERWRFGTRR